MKKIILLILLNLLIIPVNAKTYYSSYSEYSNFTEEKMETNDLVDVQTKKVYHAYTEEISYEYSKHNENGIKTGNTKLVIGEKTNIKPENLFEESTIYTYLKQSDKAIIKLKNNLNTSVYIKDMYINDESQDMSYLLTSNYAFGLSYKKSSNSYKFNIETEYKSNYNITISLVFNNEERIIGTLTNDSESLLIEEDKIFYDDEEYKSEDINSFVGKIINEEKYYILAYIYYEYMIINKNYLDLYLDEALEYKLDYDDYKILYSYRTRDKIIIEDNIVIDSKNINLMDYISASCDVKFTSDINYSKNGKYTVNYITPFKTIKKEITVDIKENYINLIKEQENALKDLKEKHDEALYKVNKKNLEIKEILNNEDDKFINDEYIKCKSKLDDLKQDKTNFKDVKIKAKSSSIIIVIFLLISYVYILLSKKVER